LALDVVELGRLPRRLSVQQTVRAPLVEVPVVGTLTQRSVATS
jgi:hypothetical protein